MDKITPPPFPLQAFKDWIYRTINVSTVYKPHKDEFLRKDVQDMYIGAKWVWSCLTRNFEERIIKLADSELDRTLQINGRKREDYLQGQLQSMIAIKRKYIAESHTKVLTQIFNAQVFDDCESTFMQYMKQDAGIVDEAHIRDSHKPLMVRKDFLNNVSVKDYGAAHSNDPIVHIGLARGSAKTKLMQARTEKEYKRILADVCNAKHVLETEPLNIFFGEDYSRRMNFLKMMGANQSIHILQFLKTPQPKDDYVAKHVKLLNDKDNYMET